MTEHLRQLEALRHDPRLQVRPEQRAALVGNIIHSTMHPYFLKKSPEEQEQFRPHYLHHMQMLADYCLREYVEHPEPRLTIEVIKGLHRVLYHNSASVPVKAMDGSMLTMVPGEFRDTPGFVRKPYSPGEWYCCPTAPDLVAQEMDLLLERLHDDHAPLPQRYLKFVLDLALLHPFSDSNGKLTCLLGDLYLLKQGVQPPYFARYWWLDKQAFDTQLLQYVEDPVRDITGFFPVVLALYADCGLGVGREYSADRDAIDD